MNTLETLPPCVTFTIPGGYQGENAVGEPITIDENTVLYKVDNCHAGVIGQNAFVLPRDLNVEQF